jgi:hypothetical protein
VSVLVFLTEGNFIFHYKWWNLSTQLLFFSFFFLLSAVPVSPCAGTCCKKKSWLVGHLV